MRATGRRLETAGKTTLRAVLGAMVMLGAMPGQVPAASGAAEGAGAMAVATAVQSPPPGSRGGSAAAAPMPTANPIALSEASVTAGRTIYAKNCRACHGATAKGDGPSLPSGVKPPSLIDAEWSHGGSDADLFRTIKLGIEPFDMMRPMGQRLSDADIWNTVNFLRDLARQAK